MLAALLALCVASLHAVDSAWEVGVEVRANGIQRTPGAENVQRIVEMGYTKEQAEQALDHASGSLGEAVRWILAQPPAPAAPSSRSGSSSTGADERATAENVQRIVEMGFTKEQAEQALDHASGSLEEAVRWILAQPPAPAAQGAFGKGLLKAALGSPDSRAARWGDGVDAPAAGTRNLYPQGFEMQILRLHDRLVHHPKW